MCQRLKTTKELFLCSAIDFFKFFSKRLSEKNNSKLFKNLEAVRKASWTIHRLSLCKCHKGSIRCERKKKKNIYPIPLGQVEGLSLSLRKSRSRSLRSMTGRPLAQTSFHHIGTLFIYSFPLYDTQL